MPLYEIHCKDCDHRFTIPLTLREYERKEYVCPECGSKNVEPMFTRVEVVTSKKS